MLITGALIILAIFAIFIFIVHVIDDEVEDEIVADFKIQLKLVDPKIANNNEDN